jgi:galactokinase
MATTAGFQVIFGRPPQVRAEAPGRVNLIGEHTDYNQGFVLPCPIPQTCVAEVALRHDRTVTCWSANQPGALESFTLGEEHPARRWFDYVQGATQGLAEAGHALDGFDLHLASAVPLGSGLSSSAALTVSLLRALRELFGLSLDDVAIARLGQRIENTFVGAPVGIMDPLACSVGRPGGALFVDTRDLTWEVIPLPAGLELAVVNSGIAHRHAAGDYRTRRAECAAACQQLGVASLRELTQADLGRLATLPSPLAERARHVITENARVQAAVAALRDGDLEAFGRLAVASHESQRWDYAVSIPEIDALVGLALAQPHVFGARLTGGGFGGSIVIFARAGHARASADAVVAAFNHAGGAATVLVP